MQALLKDTGENGYPKTDAGPHGPRAKALGFLPPTYSRIKYTSSISESLLPATDSFYSERWPCRAPYRISLGRKSAIFLLAFRRWRAVFRRLLRRAGKLRGEEAELETFERFQTSHNEIGKVGLAKDLDVALRDDGSAGIGDGSE